MTTLAEALAVAMDHAEETGEYPPELLRRAADFVLKSRNTHKVAYGWEHRSGYMKWVRDLALNLAGPPVARVYQYQHNEHWRAEIRIRGFVPADFDTAEEAKAWCDEQLTKHNVILLDKTAANYARLSK